MAKPIGLTIHHTGCKEDNTIKMLALEDSIKDMDSEEVSANIKGMKGSSSYITTTTGGNNSGYYTYDYSDTPITISGDGLNYTWHTSAIVDERVTKSYVDERIAECKSTRPIIDRLETIIGKLNELDKKYLKNAMHEELLDMMSEINKFRKESE